MGSDSGRFHYTGGEGSANGHGDSILARPEFASSQKDQAILDVDEELIHSVASPILAFDASKEASARRSGFPYYGTSKRFQTSVGAGPGIGA